MSVMRGLRIAAWAVATATFVFMGLAIAGVHNAASYLPLALVPFVVLAFLAPAVVGLLIANRQPRNRIAWILLLGTLALTIQVPIGSCSRAPAGRLQMDRASGRCSTRGRSR